MKWKYLKCIFEKQIKCSIVILDFFKYQPTCVILFYYWQSDYSKVNGDMSDNAWMCVH